jgi:hypothetical protein
MPQRTTTLRTAVLLLALAGTAWLLPAATAAVGATAPLAGSLLAGTSGQPGDPDAG